MSANSLHNDIDIDFLHDISSRMATADSLHQDLNQIVEFASAVVKCDSCFVYVREEDELVLRASKNPHEEVIDRLKLRVGQGITGWVAERREPVAISHNASQDVRFKFFNELPESGHSPSRLVAGISQRRPSNQQVVISNRDFVLQDPLHDLTFHVTLGLSSLSKQVSVEVASGIRFPFVFFFLQFYCSRSPFSLTSSLLNHQ